MASFDMAIRLGDLVQVIVLVVGGVIVFARMRFEAEAHKSRLNRMESELTKQTDILTRLASGEERMNGMDRRLTLLETRQMAHSA